MLVVLRVHRLPIAYDKPDRLLENEVHYYLRSAVNKQLVGNSMRVDAIIDACVRGDSCAVANELLSLDAQQLHVDTIRASDGGGAIHVAAGCGHVDIVALLLEHGASLSSRDKSLKTPLMLAAAGGHTSVIVKAHAMLLQLHRMNGETREHVLSPPAAAARAWHAAVNAASRSGWTSLHYAAKAGHASTISALFDVGAEPYCAARDGATPLHVAAREGHVSVVAALLHADPSGIDARVRAGRTALHGAAAAGHGAVIRTLISAGADATAADAGGSTPAHDAAQHGHLDVLKQLLNAAPALVSATDATGRCPLHYAASAGGWAASAALLAAGAAADAVDGRGYTPLYYAAVSGDSVTIEGLLQAGACTDGGSGPRSALHAAAMWGHLESVTVLLSALRSSADPGHLRTALCARDADGYTPLEQARALRRGAVESALCAADDPLKDTSPAQCVAPMGDVTVEQHTQ